jgi:hypothetical protein
MRITVGSRAFTRSRLPGSRIRRTWAGATYACARFHVHRRTDANDEATTTGERMLFANENFTATAHADRENWQTKRDRSLHRARMPRRQLFGRCALRINVLMGAHVTPLPSKP